MVADFLFFLLDVLHKQKTWCSKSGKEGKSPAWLNWDLLVKIKKKMHRQWKQDQVNWEEYRDAAGLCRDRTSKAKAQLELDLAKGARKNKNSFYR